MGYNRTMDTGVATRTRSRRLLLRGILVFRWATLGWMAALAVTTPTGFARPGLAWGAVAVAAGWTVWLTVVGHEPHRVVLGVDLAVCGGLVLASGLVVHAGEVTAGRPFFAASYPLAAVLLWGVTRGPLGGGAAAAALGLGLVAVRPLNGVPVADLSAVQVQQAAGTVVNFLVAGVAVGLVARLLDASAQAAETATGELLAERERTARLSERQSLARQIHDSVLQVLALIHKRGRELAGHEQVSGRQVAELADMAGRQEAELRALVLRPAERSASGTVSLRDALERTARGIDGVAVTVNAIGALILPAALVSEVTAAVGEALRNAAEHAGAHRVVVFAEQADGHLSLSVRDDGRGFTYDEAELAAQGKAGMLRSMKGRILDLGGTMDVETGPGRGTEVTFAIPVED